MRYTANAEGFEGQNIEVNVGFWSGPNPLVNGEPAPKGSKRGEMVLHRNDGEQIVARWKPKILGLDVPQLIVDGKVINLVEPLKWYHLIWGGWPVFLVFIGGLLGAIIGVIAFSINARVLRAEMNGALKYIISGAFSLLALAAYVAAATALSLLIKR